MVPILACVVGGGLGSGCIWWESRFECGVDFYLVGFLMLDIVTFWLKLALELQAVAGHRGAYVGLR